MLACAEVQMRKLFIERHNKAVRIIAKAMLKGRHAHTFHVVDGGALSKLPANCDVVNRIPHFLTNTKGAVERRPDVLQVLGITWEQAARFRSRCVPVPPPAGQDSNRTINLIEIRYGVDTRLQEKAAEKREQHASLRDDLQSRGWNVDTYPIALGVSGGLQQSLPVTLQALGVRGRSLSKVVSSLQRNAVEFCHAIIVQRRQLEHERGVQLFSGGGFTAHGPPGPRGGG